MLRALTLTIFVFMLISPQVFAQSTSAHVKFLKLEGVSHLASSSATIQALHETFVAPLQSNPKIALFSYVVQTQGDGHFFFHFIAQAMNQESADQFNTYIQNLDSQNFQNIKIEFHDILQIYEIAQLQVGNYVDNEDDPFAINFEISRRRDFTTLTEWQNFTDTYGSSLLSTDHSVFKNYLSDFVADPKDFQEVAKALEKGNMMAIDPRVFLVLDDNSVVNGEFSDSPFIPFRFFRNCYETRYEHGFCF